VSGTLSSFPGNSESITYGVTRTIYPALVQTSITLPLDDPSNPDQYLPRINQLDLRFAKKIQTDRLERMMLQFDIFNAFNSNPVLAAVTSFRAHRLSPEYHHARAAVPDRQSVLLLDSSAAMLEGIRFIKSDPLAREGRFDYLLVESTGIRSRCPSRSLASAGGRSSPSRSRLLRRRTDRRHRTRAPETPTPGGISSLSRTSPVRGSTRLKSLSSPSQVPCQSCPSIQVTPVTKRLDSIVRRIRPCLGIDLMDLPVSILPHQSVPSAHVSPESPPPPGAGIVASTRPVFGSIFWMRSSASLKQVLAVEGRSCMRGDIDRAQRLPARRIEGVQLVSSSKPDVLTVIRDSVHVVGTRKGSILTDDFGG